VTAWHLRTALGTLRWRIEVDDMQHILKSSG
jgi:hypothetical protein